VGVRSVVHLGLLARGGSVPRADGYRFGSEGCSALLPSASDLGRAPARLNVPAAALSLVTPLCAPADLDAVLPLATEALAAGFGEVVVNDWGVLESLAAGGAGRLTAGRLLLRLRRGPGEEDPWETLDPSSRLYMAWGALGDTPFLDVLKEHGVSRLEADLPRHWLAPPAVGLPLTLHADFRLVSLANACPFAFRPRSGTWGPTAACRRPCRGRPVILRHPPRAVALVADGRRLLEPVLARLSDLPPEVDRLVTEPRLAEARGRGA
jgi:hypothetical protein